MFDPYHEWLGIPKDRQPPNFYDLLAISPDEKDPQVIEKAALMRIGYLRTFQTGPHAEECQQVMGEIARARSVLSGPKTRAPYDAKLSGKEAATKSRSRKSQASAVDSNNIPFLAGIVVVSIFLFGAGFWWATSGAKSTAKIEKLAQANSASTTPLTSENGEVRTQAKLQPTEVEPESVNDSVSLSEPALETTSRPDAVPGPSDAEKKTLSTTRREVRTPPSDSRESSNPSPTQIAFAKKSDSPEGNGKNSLARTAVPNSAVQANALKQIKGLFEEEFRKRKDEDKLALAELLLRSGIGTRDDPVTKFVLLSEAQEIAVELGNLPVALEAFEALDAAYEIDSTEHKMSILAKIGRGARQLDEIQRLNTEYFRMVDEAVALDDYVVALDLMRQVVILSKRTRDREFRERITRRNKEFLELRASYLKIANEVRTLESKPNDPHANLSYGSFLCFDKGDWKKGLPMLAKSGEEEIEKLAKLELTRPTDLAKLLELADGWWELLKKRRGREQKMFKRHAASWYHEALPKLSGFEKARVEIILEDFDDVSASLIMEIDLGNGIKMKFRRIAASEGIGPFYMGITEVTQAQWQTIMGQNPSSILRGNPYLPVENMTFEDCQKYAALLQTTPTGKKYRFRLPTRKEWTYACRAGTSTKYFFGDDPQVVGKYVWHEGNSGDRTHPVAQLKPNPWGLYDIYGNVMEMTADPYGENYLAMGAASNSEATKLNTVMQLKKYRWCGLRLVAEPVEN